MAVLDAHLHLWDLTRLSYHWLSPSDSVLYRNFTAQELFDQMLATPVDSALLVEAANKSTEIPYMLELAQAYPWIKGVIGWASVADPPVAYASQLCGVRLPWLHTSADVVIPDVVRDYGLPCDIIADADAYPLVQQLAQSAPELTFVLAHLGLPHMTPDGAAAWANQLAPLTELPNLVMKLSGYSTSADPRPLTVDTLTSYVHTAVRLFGSERLIYGSNYPILLWAGITYQQDYDLLCAACQELSPSDQNAIFATNAMRVYGLKAGRTNE